MSTRFPATWPAPGPFLENDAVALSVLVPEDERALYEAARADVNGDLFRYHVNVPPMDHPEAFHRYLEARWSHPTETTYRVFSKRLGRPVGCVTLMNLRRDHGCVEVGSIWYAREAQKTEVNTNTMLVLFTHVFDELGYRRLEWKCNDANEDSKRAALRLGFTFEGLFRQHMVSRGENRDTAWFRLLDGEWPTVRSRLQGLARRP